MSAKALNWAWDQQPRTRTEKLVLTALADRADDDGECYPSLSWIAAKCAPISERTVKRATAGLAAQGLLLKVNRRRRAETQQLGTWIYRLPLNQGPSVSPTQGPSVVEPGAIAVAPLNRLVKADVKTTTDVVVYSARPIWDFVTEIEGEPHPRYRKARGRIVADLRIALDQSGLPPDQWPNELRRRHEALAREYGEAKATARTLVQSWAKAGAWADRAPANGNGRPQGLGALEIAKQAHDLYLEGR